MWGVTHARVLDGALDRIGLLESQHDDALAHIARFLRDHPEFDGDTQLGLARMALL